MLSLVSPSRKSPNDVFVLHTLTYSSYFLIPFVFKIWDPIPRFHGEMLKKYFEGFDSWMGNDVICL